MSDMEEAIPVIHCILDAPTSVGISDGYPTLTSLDRATWYNLVFKKKNDKIETDMLNVSIRLGLSPITNDQSEKELFRRWKMKHSLEPLFDVAPNDDSFKDDELMGNKITPNNDNTVHLDWNKNKEVNLRIRFNCISSQFPFRRDLNSLNAIFILVVRITSKNTSAELAHNFCQIRLFWPGLAREANHKANYRKHDSDLGNIITIQQQLPSAKETKLRPYEQSKLQEIQDTDVYPDDFAFNEQVIDPFPDDYEEIVMDNYLHYILKEPIDNFVCTGEDESEKTIFIEHKDSFVIKLRPNDDAIAGVSLNQIVITRFNLQKCDQTFVQRDLYEWNHSKSPMIEIDYDRSQLSFNVLDIRMLKANQIEIAWLPSQEKEETIAFKVNCFSKDYSINRSDLPLGMPFNFKMESFLKKRNIKLGSAVIQIYTTQQGSAEHMKQLWLQNNPNIARDVSESTQPIILNDRFNGELPDVQLQNGLVEQNVTQTEVNSDVNQLLNQIIPYSMHILFCLIAFLLVVSFFPSSNYDKFDQAALNQLVQTKLDIELKKFDQMQIKFDELSKSIIDQQLIGQIIEQKLKTELKQQNIAIETLIQHSLEQISLNKTEQLESKFNKFEQLIQEKFDSQQKMQIENKLDLKMIDKVVKEKINSQLTNLAIPSIESFEAKIQEKVETEIKKMQKLNIEQIESIIQKNIGNSIKLKESELNKQIENEEGLDNVESEMFENEEVLNQTTNESSTSLEYILLAPTRAGISRSHPTQTNLDRSKWYELQLNKLDHTLNSDKLLVSFQLKLNLKNTKNTLFKQWKTIHPSERLFDLEYIEDNSSKDDNQVILDNNNNKHSNQMDTASFYWNQKETVKLRIRFNVVNCQFPFMQSLASNEVTFGLHVKVTSLSKASGKVIDTSFCQIKLFWPNGAAEANHRANHQLLHAKSEDNFAPATSNTKFESFHSKKLSKVDFVEDETFVEKLNSILDLSQDKVLKDSKNYLHYILTEPTGTFVNVTTNDDQLFKGFFLEEDELFAIKLHPNVKNYKKLSNSFVRTRFELNLNSRPFNEEELINWSAGQKFAMIEINYLQSKLNDVVYDIRQIEVNCIEMIWLPKVDQSPKELVIAFNVNSIEPQQQPFIFRMNSFMTNGTVISEIDSASTGIFTVEGGQVKVGRKNWLKLNAKTQATESSILILNDISVAKSSFKFNFNPLKLFAINFTFVGWLLLSAVWWIIRAFLSWMIISFVVNTYKSGLDSDMKQNAKGLLVMSLLAIAIWCTF